MNNNQNEENEFNNTSFTPDNQDDNNLNDSTNQGIQDPATNTQYNESFYYDSPTETSFETIQNSRKKPKFGVIAAAVVILVLLAGSVYAFANWKTISNSIALMTKSPLKYYTGIERKTFDKQIDSFTESYGKYVSYKKQADEGLAQEGNIKLTVNPQFTSLLGLSDFQSLEAKISALTKKTQGKASIGLFYNEQSLFNVDTLFNTDSGDLYTSIPELSTAYIYYSMKDIMDNTEDFSIYSKELDNFLLSDTLSPEALNKLLKTYSSVVVDNIDNMVLDKNVRLSTSNVSNTYNVLTTKLEADDLANIANSILNTAKDDKDLKNLLVTMGACTEDEYNTFIENALADLKISDFASDSSNFIYMRVYVDKTGEIIGREFTDSFDISLDQDASSIGYFHLAKSDRRGYKVWVKVEGQNAFEFTVDGSVSSKGFNGDTVISFSDYDNTYEDYATVSLNIAMENVKLDEDKLNGKFTLTSDMLMGASIIMDCKSEEEKANVKFQLMYAGMEAGAIEVSVAKSAYQDFEFPPASDQVYDGVNDMNSYLLTADFESFISRIEEVTGQDISSLFNSLTSGYSY